MLPQLLPHKDTSYLLAFGSDNCDHCDQMEPVLQRLEEDLGNFILFFSSIFVTHTYLYSKVPRFEELIYFHAKTPFHC